MYIYIYTYIHEYICTNMYIHIFIYLYTYAACFDNEEVPVDAAARVETSCTFFICTLTFSVTPLNCTLESHPLCCHSFNCRRNGAPSVMLLGCGKRHNTSSTSFCHSCSSDTPPVYKLWWASSSAPSQLHPLRKVGEQHPSAPQSGRKLCTKLLHPLRCFDFRDSSFFQP